MPRPERQQIELRVKCQNRPTDTCPHEVHLVVKESLLGAFTLQDPPSAREFESIQEKARKHAARLRKEMEEEIALLAEQQLTRIPKHYSTW